MTDEIIKNKSKPPSRIATIFGQDALGEVSIKRISMNDWEEFETLINEPNSRHFTASVLHQQLQRPILTLSEIEALPDSIISELCVKLLESEPNINKHFSNAEGNFFDNFQNSIVAFETDMKTKLLEVGRAFEKQTQLIAEQLAPAFEVSKKISSIISTYDFQPLVRYLNMVQNTYGTIRFPDIRMIPPQIPIGDIEVLIPPLAKPQGRQIDSIENPIGSLLIKTDPDLERQRIGAWETLNGQGQDRISQAAHSMREVLRRLLDILSPENEIVKAPWYVKPSGFTPVTRKMRIRFAISGNNPSFSESTQKLIESFSEAADEAYAKLSATAHVNNHELAIKIDAYLRACEVIMLLLLVNRCT